MNKSFVSVFPVLQLNTELKDLFEDTEIIKVLAYREYTSDSKTCDSSDGNGNQEAVIRGK